jgi:hypothetical protein
MAPALCARAWTVLLGSALLIQACDSPRVEAPPSIAPSLAKSGGGPSVSAANPSSGHQGDVTLDVTITGSGFDSGSQASWQLNGAPYSKIIVNNTRFNSPTSLTANITIAADAAVTTYDIAVLTSTGKKGIGAELFTVTYAIPLAGVSEGRAISDGGLVAGLNGSQIVTATPGGPTVVVATSGEVRDMDRSGHTLAGVDPATKPTIWTSATGEAGSWVATTLADIGNGGGAFGVASDAAGDAVMLTGNVFGLDGRKNPAVWTRIGGVWQMRVNPLPPGTPGMFGHGINGRGQVVGMEGTGCCKAAYWDSLGNATILAALTGARNAAAYSINGDGTVAVGNSGVTAVLWRRTLSDGVYGPWTGPITLENTAGLCGKSGSSVAYDINTAGTVAVGSSCGVAVAWKIAAGVVTGRQLLQGLGPPNQSIAFGVSDTSSPLAAGSAKSSTGVYWWGF